MSLYIATAQSVETLFRDENDWELFDEVEQELDNIAEKHGLFINRKSIGEYGEPGVILTHQRLKFNFFFPGSFISKDNIIIKKDFKENVDSFIQELESIEKFSFLHEIEWSDAQVRHFVIS